MSSENHKIWKSCLIGLPNLFIEKIKCVGFLDELLCAHQENGRSSLRAKFEGWENRLHTPIKNMTLTGVNKIPYGKRLFIIDQHIQNPKIQKVQIQRNLRRHYKLHGKSREIPQ